MGMGRWEAFVLGSLGTWGRSKLVGLILEALAFLKRSMTWS